MGLKRRPIAKKPKHKRKRALDAEDRQALLEKKGLKKHKKLEYNAKLAEINTKQQAIKAAGTIHVEDVVRAIASKASLKSRKSPASSIPDVNSLLSAIGVQKVVDDFKWSSESEVEDTSSESSGESDGDDLVGASESENGFSEDDCDDGGSDSDAAAESVESSDELPSTRSLEQLHKRVTFPESTAFTQESQQLLSGLIKGKDVVVCLESFHEPSVARSCYLSLSAYILSHALHSSAVVEKNNKKSKKHPEIEFRDQGPTRPRVCVLCPFRSNAFEFVKNLIMLLNLSDEDLVGVGNYESFMAEYEGQDSVNEHSKNWESWRRELFKGHYDDSNYDDFVIGISVIHGKVRLHFPKFSSQLSNLDLIVGSPIALSRIAAEDRKAIRLKSKAAFDEQPECEEEEMFTADQKESEELPVMDFLSSIEILVVDRIDALMMQNAENTMDIIGATNQRPVATITADISRIEEKFLDPKTAIASRQTVFLSGSSWFEEYMKFVRKDNVEILKSPFSGASLNRALKQKIKQQFFVRVPDLLEYFQSTFWKDVGNEIRNLVIVVARSEDLTPLKEFLEEEGVVDCFLSEHTLSDIGGKRRKQIKQILRNFREGLSRTIVVTERLLWYQRIRVTGGRHVLFFGPPRVDSVYADILADMVDPLRCNSTCLYANSDGVALERIVGTSNLPKLISKEGTTGKTTVFTP